MGQRIPSPHPLCRDASLQAWLHATDGTADIYYDKGSLAGLALVGGISKVTGSMNSGVALSLCVQ